MSLFKKRPPVIENDIDEARELREEAVKERKAAQLQGFELARIASYFAARSELNHFGDAISISFTRKDR